MGTHALSDEIMLHVKYRVPYDSLLQALQDALKYVGKSQKAGKQAQQESLTRRIAATSAMLQAQQLFTSDAASAVQTCNGLIVEVRLSTQQPNCL